MLKSLSQALLLRNVKLRQSAQGGLLRGKLNFSIVPGDDRVRAEKRSILGSRQEQTKWARPGVGEGLGEWTEIPVLTGELCAAGIHFFLVEEGGRCLNSFACGCEPQGAGASC